MNFQNHLFSEAIIDQNTNLRQINLFGYDKDNQSKQVSTTNKSASTAEAIKEYQLANPDWKTKFERIEAYFADGK